MSKSLRKIQVLTMANGVPKSTDTLDIQNYNGFSAQVVSPAAAVGTAVPQVSNDGTHWDGVNDEAGSPISVALVASNSISIVCPNVYHALSRILITTSAGPGNYTITQIAKEI